LWCGEKYLSIRKPEWKGNKAACWIDRNPTHEELLTQFTPLINSELYRYRHAFRLSPEDVQDMKSEMILKLFSLKPRDARKVWYVTRSLRNASATASLKLAGGRVGKNPKSNRQRTVSLTLLDDPLHQGDTFTAMIRAISSHTPQIDNGIALQRVRKLLSPEALKVFNYTLNDAEQHSSHAMNKYYLMEQMTQREVTNIRQEIVACLHANGLLTQYPPPGRKGTRLTAVERCRWLERLKRDYTSVSEAAKAEGCAPGTIDFHCWRIHGVRFSKWVRQNDEGYTPAASEEIQQQVAM
jgi:hypothetical protein